MPNTVGLCSAARLAICSRWSAVTVSPASAMANMRNLFAQGSSTCGLGGKAHGAGHASPVSVGVGSGSAEGCSIVGASHLAIPLLFVSARESQRQAGVLRLSSTCQACAFGSTTMGSFSPASVRRAQVGVTSPSSLRRGLGLGVSAGMLTLASH